MINQLIRWGVLTSFALTGRDRASVRIQASLDAYLALMEPVSDTQGRTPVTVRPLQGVAEDMRGWSLFQIIEHNTMVNRAISATVVQLARGEPLSGAALTDPRHGVMPASDPGPEVMEPFIASVRQHLEAVATLGSLKGTATSDHPVFGPFDAHQWHCMFGFHLNLHLNQARHVIRGLQQAPHAV